MLIASRPVISKVLGNLTKHCSFRKTFALKTCNNNALNESVHMLKRGLVSSSNENMDGIPEGCLLGLGNPLLDISITADINFLENYELEPNNAILAEVKHMSMFDHMMEHFTPDYIPGGAIQNSIRVAQWLLQKPKATTFFGCIGKDERGTILGAKAQDVGVNVKYQVNDKTPTGVCGAIITGENRSLVTHLGAADFFTHMFLEREENWKEVKKALIYYIGGFFFPVCTESILMIARHACENNKTLVMNLSAPFLCGYFANPKISIMPYVDILFGNETEAATFANRMNWQNDNIRDIALKTEALPKHNKKRKRIVVFTQGRDPTIVCTDGEITEHPINPIQKHDIKDTNGCGDAFVGGFLSQLIQGKPLQDCLRCGNYAARTVIQHYGCTYPEKPDFN